MPRYRVEVKRVETKMYETVVEATDGAEAEAKGHQLVVPFGGWQIADAEESVDVTEILDGGVTP